MRRRASPSTSARSMGASFSGVHRARISTAAATTIARYSPRRHGATDERSEFSNVPRRKLFPPDQIVVSRITVLTVTRVWLSLSRDTWMLEKSVRARQTAKGRLGR